MPRVHQTPSPPLNPPLVDTDKRPRRGALLMAALSGLLLVAAFPHLDWGWVAWVALVPFLATFPHRRMRDALAAGAMLGVIFFGGVWYWMAIFAGHVIGRPLGVVVWAGAALAQTATMLVFAAGAQFLSLRCGDWRWRLGVPALWAVGEWARQFGPLGTGWSDLAYTQHAALLPLQLTKLTGIFGLSFLIVLVNVAVCELIRRPRSALIGHPPPAGPGEGPVTGSHVPLDEKRSPVMSGPSPIPMGDGWPKAGGRAFPFAVACVVLVVLGYGAVALRTENLRPTFAAAALQADIDQNVPWRDRRPADPAYTRRVMDTFAAQASEAAARGARLVVWPETGFPGYLATDGELRAEAAATAVRNHQAMLIGSVEADFGARQAANTLYLIDAAGNVTGGYRKQRLVPFGEYVPYRKWLPFLDKLHLTIFDMVAGAAQQPVLDAGPPAGKIGAAICYDSTDSEIVRRLAAHGADLLVVATDDTWFGRTAAARQHAAMAAVRAAEDDRYLVRCAATGISQVIAPTGRVLTEADLFTQKVVLAPVQPRRNMTLYARWGDWFVALCALGLFLLVLPKWEDPAKQGGESESAGGNQCS